MDGLDGWLVKVSWLGNIVSVRVSCVLVGGAGFLLSEVQ